MSKSITLDRGQQLMLLRKLQLPNVGTLHPGIIKSILRTVDGYGATCWASIPTIACETQFSERTVYRALSILVELGYLSKDSRTGQTNSYSINWDQLTPVSRSGVEHTEPLTPSQPTPDSQSVTPDSQSVTPDSQSPNTKRNVIETKKKRNSSSKLRFDGEDLKFAEWMFSKIREVAPKSKKPNFQDWANAIRLMREADKLSLDEIRKVFTWANQDQFWKTNILSVGSLREKFAGLDARMRSPSAVNGKPRFTSADLKTLQANPNAGKM